MPEDSKQVWTPHWVHRPTAADPYRGAYVVLRATWDTFRDTLWFIVDGHRHEWYRRGMPVFDQRSDCVQDIKSRGWELG